MTGNEMPCGPGPFVSLCPLVLASASPRRRDLLNRLGLSFAVEVAAVDETPQPAEPPDLFVRRLAAAKARAVADRMPEAYVLAADTVVVLDDDILGKPADEAAAVATLERLAGREHEVWTGYAIFRQELLVEEAVASRVNFAAFSPEVARAYAATGEPLDKAGSYGIQGIGGFLVEGIDGSYSNVVGLPLAEVVGALLRLDVIAPRQGTGRR